MYCFIIFYFLKKKLFPCYIIKLQDNVGTCMAGVDIYIPLQYFNTDSENSFEEIYIY